jgi:hypothetical protein
MGEGIDRRRPGLRAIPKGNIAGVSGVYRGDVNAYGFIAEVVESRNPSRRGRPRHVAMLVCL